MTDYHEFNLRVKEYVFDHVDFLDMFNALKAIYKIKSLPSDLEAFINHIENKISKLTDGKKNEK